MQDADVIIPLASLVGAPICKKFPKLSHEINFNSAINIIENKSDNQKLLCQQIVRMELGIKIIIVTNSELRPISEYAEQKLS